MIDVRAASTFTFGLAAAGTVLESAAFELCRFLCVATAQGGGRC